MTPLALVGPPLPGHLERHFDGCGAVVRKEQSLQSGQTAEPGRQLLGRLMAEVGKDDLLKLLGLGSDGSCDGWLGMAVQSDPPTADRINQTAPISQLKFTAPGRAHLQWFRAGRHLGGRMPEVRMPAHRIGF